MPLAMPSIALLPRHGLTLFPIIYLLTRLYTNNPCPLPSNTTYNYSSPTSRISPTAPYTKNTLNNSQTKSTSLLS
jgi:hypothetical protein